MKTTATISRALSILLLGLIVSAKAQYATNFFINPAHVMSNKPFSLSALSYEYSCASTFTNLSVALDGTNIDLSYLPGINPAIDCIAQDSRAYGPNFSMSALPAGTYSVWVIQQLNCNVCVAMPVSRAAGTLVVQDSSTRKTWFLQPKQVVANTYFTLKLLNEFYGNCGTHFTHTSYTVAKGSIEASFAVEQDTGVVCIMDLHPNGPAYDSLKLAAGKYPVYAVEHAACSYSPIPCPTAVPIPQLVDTLEVLSPSGLKPKHEHASHSRARMGIDLNSVGGYHVNGRKVLNIHMLRERNP